MKAVLYAAKSTDDKHGSIPGQLADCRALAGGEGTVIGEFFDEAKSAYRGNRGDELVRAMALAERERCALIVQHSDRLARGDGDRARHLVEIVLWARKAGVTLRSVQDPQTFDGMGLVYAALMGDRNHEDSARKSKSVRDGLKRRAERGQPVGALPVGFKAEDVVVAGKGITRRVIDPEHEPTVRRMFDLAGPGTTPGEVSRTLNREGLTTIRGKTWTTRAVRDVLRNEDYAGRNGYPRIIEPEAYEAVQRWLDESSRGPARGRTGRPAADDFALAGLAFCARCGATMRSRRCSTTGRRTYKCSNGLDGRSLCDAPPVPAREAEALLLGGLRHYTADLDGFLIEQTTGQRQAQEDREQRLRELRDQLVKLDRSREKLLADYRAQVDAGRSTAYLVLESVERLDGEREAIQRSADDAQALVDEHAGLPSLDEARSLYERLMAFAEGELERAATPAEVKSALRRVLIEVRLDADGRTPLVDADLRLIGDTGQPFYVVESPQETLV